MGELVIDYSFAHPNPAAIRGAGYLGAMRYLSNEPAKDLTPAELLALHALGFEVGLVWEAGATDELGGGPVGTSEATLANRMADALGWPASRPVYYAADFAASGQQLAVVADYLRAAGRQKRPAGIYGSIATVDTMLAEGICLWGWQTSAWSNGRVSAHAQLYQRQRPTLAIAGAGTGSFDENVALAADWGGWNGTTAAAPTGSPPSTLGKDDDMVIIRQSNGAAWLIAGSKAVGIPDGADLNALHAAGVGVAQVTDAFATQLRNTLV
jgi:hypothetical protein